MSAETGSRAGPAERLLVIALRISAVVMGFALAAVAMPRAWMAAVHEAAGLGTFPSGPIVEYLARSLSAFYAMFGGLMWLVSTDVRRFAPILWYSIWTGFAFGAAVFVIDVAAGMPAYWRWCEGPFIVALSGLLLVLARRAAEGGAQPCGRDGRAP